MRRKPKQLNEIFSKAEVKKIVDYACGHKMTKREVKETQMETIDIKEYKKLDAKQQAWCREENTLQQLVVPIYMRDNRDYHDMEVVIHSTGSVVYRNMGGCQFRLRAPIQIYKIIVPKEEELRKLTEYLWPIKQVDKTA